MESRCGCYSFIFDIDESNSYYKSDIRSYDSTCRDVFSKDGTELLCCESKNLDYGYF